MRVIAIIVMVLISSQSLHAVERWISLGLGVGSQGLAGGAVASMQASRHLLVSLRWYHTRDLSTVNRSTGFLAGEKFQPYSSDIGFLLGWTTKDAGLNRTFSASVGLGEATIVDQGERVDGLFGDYYDKVEYSATGLLLQSQFFFDQVGFQFFGNINKFQDFGGFLISWRFTD